jgi:hypothetical protein
VTAVNDECCEGCCATEEFRRLLPAAGAAWSYRYIRRSAAPLLQLWLQLALFRVIRRRARPYLSAGHPGYGTVVNRHERDHDGLAV